MFLEPWTYGRSVSKSQHSIHPHMDPETQVPWGYPSYGYSSQESYASRQNWSHDSRNIARISDGLTPDSPNFGYNYVNHVRTDNQTMVTENSRTGTYTVLPSSPGPSSQKHSVHSRETSSTSFRKSYVGHAKEIIVSKSASVERQLDVQTRHVEGAGHFIECDLIEDLQYQALPIVHDCLRYVQEVQSSMSFNTEGLSSSCKHLIRGLEELIKLLHWEHRCRAPGFGIHGEYIKELRILLPALKELRTKLRRRRACERWQQVLDEAQPLVNMWVQRLKEAQDENPDWYQSLSSTRHLGQLDHSQQLKRTEILAHTEQKHLKRSFRLSYRN